MTWQKRGKISDAMILPWIHNACKDENYLKTNLPIIQRSISSHCSFCSSNEERKRKIKGREKAVHQKEAMSLSNFSLPPPAAQTSQYPLANFSFFNPPTSFDI
jgi:hypothetical protein